MNAQMGLPGMRQLASPNSAFKPVPQMLPPYSKNCFDIIQFLQHVTVWSTWFSGHER